MLEVEHEFFIYTAILFAFIAIEFIFPNQKPHENPFRRKYFFDDILFTVTNMVMGFILAWAVLKFIFYCRNEWGALRGFAFIRQMSWGWQFFCAFLFRDFCAYCMHRFTHSKHFWKFHVAHHEPDYLDAAASFRVHPINFLFNVSRAPILFMLGFDFSLLPVLGIIQYAHNYFVHTNVKLDWGFFNYLVISPYAHRFHHAADEKYLHKNYGIYLSIWDQMFGTFVYERNVDVKVGVPGHTRKDFVGTITDPFYDFKPPNAHRDPELDQKVDSEQAS